MCENLIQNLEHLFLFHSIVPTRYGFTRFDVPTFKKRSMINLLVELRSCYGSIEPVASPFLWGPMEHIQRNRLLSYSEIETMGSLWGFAVKPFAVPIFHLGSPRKTDPTKYQISFGKLRKKLGLGGVRFPGPSKVANCQFAVLIFLLVWHPKI